MMTMEIMDNMDRKIERKKGLRKKHIPYVLGGGFVVAVVCWLLFGDHRSTLKVDASTLTVVTVGKDLFNDYVSINGQVSPITSMQISVLEGGVVEEIVAEEGALLRRGDPIIRLQNAQLNLQIMDSEASLAEKENFLRNTLVQMEQQKLTLQQDMLQLDLDEARKKRHYLQNERLYREKLIAKEDYLQSKEEYELSVKKRELVMERQKQDSIYRSIQIENLEESLNNMRRNIMLVRQRVENLLVKSPIDGQLGSLDVSLGQSVGQGAAIGQINDLSDYKIETSIDEHYIDRVRTGLDASFERGGNRYDLRIRKVYPDVKGGQFKADLTFVGQRPDNIRSGQTYHINLELGMPTEAVLVPRGAFFYATGGSWIYVVSADGTSAVKRPIRIGRQNPQYYEVIEGLEPGEKVIVSGYETFHESEILVLK